jgi:type IV pilus assembly protein PilO
VAITLDDIKNMSTTRKVILVCIVLLLFAYLYYSYFYQAALEKKSKLVVRFSSLQQEIAEKQIIVKQIEKYRKERDALKEDLRVALTILPEQKEIPSLLDSVSEAGRRVDIEFLLFQPIADVPKEFYAEVPVKVEASGGYHNIVFFFEKVAKLPRIVNITDLSIKKGVVKDNIDSLTASCLVKTYVFLEKEGEEKAVAAGSK